MSSYRKERVSELLLGFLGEEVRRLRDPRAQFITLTSVEISADLKHAKIFWSALGGVRKEDEEPVNGQVGFLSKKEIAEVEESLSRAKGFLKKRIADELELRHTPNLHFEYDNSLVHGFRIEELLNKVRA